MRAHCSAPTVLIVDDDLAFVWWLGEVFTWAGYQAVPALKCRQALTLSKTLGLEVDLVAVNPRLPGVASLVEALAGAKPNIGVILIGDHDGEPYGEAFLAHAVLERPSGSEPISRRLWQHKLRKVLEKMALASDTPTLHTGNLFRGTPKDTLT